MSEHRQMKQDPSETNHHGMNRPIVFFRTKRNYYLFEAYTNGIHKISGITYKIFPLLIKAKPLFYVKNKVKNEFKANKIERFFKQDSKRGILGYLLKAPQIKSSNPLYSKKKLKQMDDELHSVQLELTANCNLRCKYCFFSNYYPTERNYSSTKMSWETAKKAILFLKNHSDKSKSIEIVFFGGEPLLQFDLIKKIVAHSKHVFKDKSLVFSMSTNGTLLTKDKCRFLVKENFRFHISLDGPKNVHDAFRTYGSGGGSFDRVIHGINNLRQIDEKFVLTNVRFTSVKTTPYRFKEISDFFTKVLSVPADAVRHTFVSESNTTFYQKHPKASADRRALSELFSEFAKDRRNQSGLPSGFYSQSLIQPPFMEIYKRSRKNVFKSPGYFTLQCMPGVGKIFVAVNGDIHLCDKIEHRCPIGHIDRGYDMVQIHGLLDGYYSEVSQTCTQCWAIRFCMLCVARTIKGGKFSEGNKQIFCRDHKKSLKKNLVRYCSILEENPNAFNYMWKMSLVR